MKTYISVIALTALLAACNPAKTDVAAPTAEEAAKIVDAAEASFTSGDSAKIMANYVPDAVFFDPGYNDPTNDRATATKWTDGFVALKPTAFSPGNRMLQVIDASTIISSGVGTMDITGPKGPEKSHMRYTDVYRKQADGSWLIVHEHLSNPPQPAAAAAAE
jgi:hypothetical protein